MIVVGTTLAAFVMDDPDTWGAWLYNAEEMVEASEHALRFFVAIEVDARGLEPFAPLLARLEHLKAHLAEDPTAEAGAGVEWWTYSLDDGRTTVTTANRLRHLTMGQNLVSEYATAEGATHLLFMAADTAPPADAVDKLVEVDEHLVGGHLRTYAFGGNVIKRRLAPGAEEIQLMEHFPTAAFVLIKREVFKRLRWRVDVELGMTDDPSYAYDVEDFFEGWPVIRLDAVGQHYPEAIGPIEGRGHDMTVHRT